MSKKRNNSLVWKMGLNEFKILIAQSSSYKEALESLGYHNRGNNYRTLKRRIEEEGIDDSHIRNKPRNYMAVKKTRIPLEKILVRNGVPYNNARLRNRLIAHNFLNNICSICGIGPEWNGQDLTLQLDHIDGDHRNNLLQNLRLLCPNCHSQTPTFAGKKLAIINRCKCGEVIHRTSKRCVDCSRKHSRKTIRPTKRELELMLSKDSWCTVGRYYGVSDNAVRKWAKKYGMSLNRGDIDI